MDDIRSLQQALVRLLRENKTLTSDAVAEAFMAVPRHLFLPGEPVERAYQDIAIQVRAGADGRWTSSSSQPSMMAIMLEQLELRPGMRVLEIGAGTGYNAALMAALVGPGGSVTAVDIQPDLVADAQEHLRAAGIENVRVATGDGGYGWPEDAPYDRIILTAASSTITPAWREQLAPGGRIVLPLDLGGSQISTALEKRGSELVSISLYGCGFMPLQGSFGMPPFWQELAPGMNLLSPSDPGLDPSALLGWLAQPGEALPLGMRLKGDELWPGLVTWLTIQEPDRSCNLAAEEAALGTLDPRPEALRWPMFHFPSGETTMHVWLLLPAPPRAAPAPSGAGAALLRRSHPEGTPSAEAEGFDLEVVALGDGLDRARGLVETLRAWDEAGRPSQSRLQIRAVAAGAEAADAEDAGAEAAGTGDTQLQPGEHLLPRPWTNFMVGYKR